MLVIPSRSGMVSRSDPVPANSPGQTGRKVRLREVGLEDRRALIGFDRDSAGDGFPQVGNYRHWAAHRSGPADSGDAVHYGIETLHGGLLVGSVCTIGADPVSGQFSYGIGIGPQHRRCGYAGDAIATLLAYMFEQRGFRRCEISVYGGNLASLSLHGGLGFREQGRLRDTELSRGDVRYLVLMSITAEEFAARRPNRAATGPRRGRHWRLRRGQHRRTHDARLPARSPASR